MDNPNISEWIRNNLKKAQAYAIESKEYLKKNGIPPFKTRGELLAFLSQKKLKLDSERLEALWMGSQILEALPRTSSEQETPQEAEHESPPLGPVNIVLLPLIFLMRRRSELMEDAPGFKKIEEDLKKEWLENNPGKTFDSREWLDYRYGNLDDPDGPTLKSDAEKTFREKNPKRAADYDKKVKKGYKNPDEDPAIVRSKRNIDEHIKARKAYFEKNGIAGALDDVERKIREHEWDRFAKRYETKARAYRGKLPDLDRALDRHEIRQKLLEYKESTGRKIGYIEKEHREAPKVSVEEATRRLEAIQPHIPIGQVYVSRAKPSTAAPTRTTQRDFGTKRKRGAIDSLNSTIRNLWRAGQGIRFLITGAQGLSVVASNPHLVAIAASIAGVVAFIIIFVIFFGNPSLPFLGGGGETGSGGGPTGTGKTTSGLNYYIPIRDTGVVPQDIRSTILASWPNAQINNWDIIVSESVANGWNPAFILTLWVEESGAQGAPSYTDALGCDPSNPSTDIYKSLSCVFKSFKDYTNDRFADFMCRYGGDNFGDAPCTFNVYNPNFPKNIRFWYEKFVLAGSYGALIEVPLPGQATLSATCPIAGGTAATVTCGSFFTLRSNCGHCRADAGYANYMNLCTYEEINYAEDIDGPSGQDVILPLINNAVIDWTLQGIKPSTVGSTRHFSGINRQTNDEYWIQFHHVDPNYGVINGKSGDIGARICTSSPDCNHVHVEFSTVTPGGRTPQDAPLFLCI